MWALLLAAFRNVFSARGLVPSLKRHIRWIRSTASGSDTWPPEPSQTGSGCALHLFTTYLPFPARWRVCEGLSSPPCMACSQLWPPEYISTSINSLRTLSCSKAAVQIPALLQTWAQFRLCSAHGCSMSQFAPFWSTGHKCRARGTQMSQV